MLTCAPDSEPNSRTGSCVACPPGKKREKTTLFSGNRKYNKYKLVYDTSSRRPLYALANSNEVGYLQTVGESQSHLAKRLVSDINFHYIFSVEDAGDFDETSIFEARLPLGELNDKNGIFVARNDSKDQYADVLFKNTRISLRCR